MDGSEKLDDPIVRARLMKGQAKLPIARSGSALQSVLLGSSEIDPKISALAEYTKQFANKPGTSSSIKSTGPADFEEMSRPAMASGIPMVFQETGRLVDDGAGHKIPEKAMMVDPHAFDSKISPQLEDLLNYQRSRPTDLDLSPLADFVNFASMSDRKVTAPKQLHSADQAADEQTNLMRLIQKEEDNKKENQLKLAGELSKMMTFAPSVTQSISQPPSGAGMARLNRLSDKQVTEVNNLDKLISSLKTIKEKAKGHPDWVGPIDRLKPDWSIGPDHSAFRAETGQLEDTYRTATTGASAPFKELELLRGRLPTEKDQHPNFLKKADEAIVKAQEIKRRVLESYRLQGKNVDPGFEASPAPYAGTSERSKAPTGTAQSASQILESLRKKQ